MQRGPEGTKYCHLIWATRNGRSWFKIAAAARFCERAVHHACTTLGWSAEVVAVSPNQVHLLVAVPVTEDRRTVSPRLQDGTTRLLMDAHVLPGLDGALWEGRGWCAVLADGLSAATVRRQLSRRARASTPEATAPP